MNSINNGFDFYEILNYVPEGIHTYYNKKRRCLEYHNKSNLVSKNLIKAPCVYEMKCDFWAKFYSLLNEEQYDLAQSYPYKKGYFNYLREIGLYEIYEEAELLVKEEAVRSWIEKNEITF